jgi:hypothetical protein
MSETTSSPERVERVREAYRLRRDLERHERAVAAVALLFGMPCHTVKPLVADVRAEIDRQRPVLRHNGEEK